MDVGLFLSTKPGTSLVGYCDVDWASNPDERKFTASHCVYLVAKKQRNIMLGLVY